LSPSGVSEALIINPTQSPLTGRLQIETTITAITTALFQKHCLLPYLSLKKWPTHHEEEPQEALGEAVSGPVVIEAVIEGVTEGADVDDEDLVVAEQNPRRKNGNPSPSWADLSKPERLQAWSKSTCILFPSKSIRLWIGFCPSSRMKS
jgi:hypothetical protein